MRRLPVVVLYVLMGACASKGGVASDATPAALDCTDDAGRPAPVEGLDVYRTARVDTFPRLIQAGLQDAPEGRAGARAEVDLRFVVDERGQVVPCTVMLIAASDPEFIPSSVRMVRGSTYSPAKSGGEPVRALVRQRVTFR